MSERKLNNAQSGLLCELEAMGDIATHVKTHHVGSVVVVEVNDDKRAADLAYWLDYAIRESVIEARVKKALKGDGLPEGREKSLGVVPDVTFTIKSADAKLIAEKVRDELAVAFIGTREAH